MAIFDAGLSKALPFAASLHCPHNHHVAVLEDRLRTAIDKPEDNTRAYAPGKRADGAGIDFFTWPATSDQHGSGRINVAESLQVINNRRRRRRGGAGSRSTKFALHRVARGFTLSRYLQIELGATIGRINQPLHAQPPGPHRYFSRTSRIDSLCWMITGTSRQCAPTPSFSCWPTNSTVL
jgi:hypothetical protein